MGFVALVAFVTLVAIVLDMLFVSSLLGQLKAP
jgi:hypothetical protein